MGSQHFLNRWSKRPSTIDFVQVKGIAPLIDIHVIHRAYTVQCGGGTWCPIRTERQPHTEFPLCRNCNPRCKIFCFAKNRPKYHSINKKKIHNAQDQKEGLARNRTGVARKVQTRSNTNEGSEPEVITATLRNRSKKGELP
jgi:hypothetical protein